MKRFLLLIIFFYILALLETSFLIHFKIFQYLPNLILIAVLLLNLLENPKNNGGTAAAFFGGFFWDIFSEQFLGFHILLLVGLALVIKIILRKYFHFPPFLKLKIR